MHEVSTSSRESSGIFEDLELWFDHREIVSMRSNHLEDISENLTVGKHLPKHYSIESRCSESLNRKTRDSGIANISSPAQDLDEYIDMQPASILSLSIDSTCRTGTSCSPKLNIDQDFTHVSKFNSSKSMELLTAEVINEITDFSLTSDDADKQSLQHEYDYPNLLCPSLGESCDNPKPPEVPQRHSSLSTRKEERVPDDVLLHQGKRLGLILYYHKGQVHGKSTLGSVKAVFNKMMKPRKVSLPVVKYKSKTAPPLATKPRKKKFSLQMISEPILTKHSSMESISTSVPALSQNDTISIPSGLTGKRSHSLIRLQDATDRGSEVEYETMFPQWKIHQNQLSSTLDIRCNESEWRDNDNIHITPPSPPSNSNKNSWIREDDCLKTKTLPPPLNKPTQKVRRKGVCSPCPPKIECTITPTQFSMLPPPPHESKSVAWPSHKKPFLPPSPVTTTSHDNIFLLGVERKISSYHNIHSLHMKDHTKSLSSSMIDLSQKTLPPPRPTMFDKNLVNVRRKISQPLCNQHISRGLVRTSRSVQDLISLFTA